jgi:UDP-GlcNAc:undecaprenyl-phosphate GlcNAc-1-phosphate transferase
MASTFTTVAAAGCSVFALSAALTGLVQRWSMKHGQLAQPRPDRWHDRPVALHGGLGFMPPFLLAGIVLLYDGRIQPASPGVIALAASLLAGSLGLLLAGLLDDLRPFNPAAKLLVQLVAATPFIYCGGIYPATGIFTLNVAVSYFWFALIINAINLIDNMDGLCAGVSLAACVGLVALALVSGQTGVTLITAALLAAAVGGFWLHNRPPARIFMGDSGSLSLGFALAALSMPTALNGWWGFDPRGDAYDHLMLAAIPVTLLSLPLFDTVMVTVTRLWRGQPPAVGGRDHVSHRLAGRGIPGPAVPAVLSALGLAAAAAAVLIQRRPLLAVPVVGLAVTVMALFGSYLGQVQFEGKRLPFWRALADRLLYQSRAFEILLDIILIIVCFFGAHLLRFEGALTRPLALAMMQALPVVTACCLVSFYLSGIYRSQWRLVSASDLLLQALGVSGGTVLSMAAVTVLSRFGPGYSRSAYLIFGLLLLLAQFSSRFSFRLIDQIISGNWQAAGAGRIPVLIYGSGRREQLLLEQLGTRGQAADVTVAGFVDDGPGASGRRLCGLPVDGAERWAGRSWPLTPQVWFLADGGRQGDAGRFARRWSPPAEVFRWTLAAEKIDSISDGSIDA